MTSMDKLYTKAMRRPCLAANRRLTSLFFPNRVNKIHIPVPFDNIVSATHCRVNAQMPATEAMNTRPRRLEHCQRRHHGP
jgi:hypothetical protein